MDPNEMNKLYEAHDAACPFELARKLKVTISYVDFPLPIYGYYKSVLYAEPILINEKLSLEQQEKVCEYLMIRHLKYNGIEYCLDQETFEQLEKQEKKLRSLKRQPVRSRFAPL